MKRGANDDEELLNPYHRAPKKARQSSSSSLIKEIFSSENSPSEIRTTPTSTDRAREIVKPIAQDYVLVDNSCADFESFVNGLMLCEIVYWGAVYNRDCTNFRVKVHFHFILILYTYHRTRERKEKGLNATFHNSIP